MHTLHALYRPSGEVSTVRGGADNVFVLFYPSYLGYFFSISKGPFCPLSVVLGGFFRPQVPRKRVLPPVGTLTGPCDALKYVILMRGKFFLVLFGKMSIKRSFLEDAEDGRRKVWPNC